MASNNVMPVLQRTVCSIASTFGLNNEVCETCFRSLLDSFPDLMWISSRDKGHVYFNRLWLEFVGGEMERELGNGWAARVHPEDLPRRQEAYVSASERHQGFAAEYRLRRADGEYRWMSDTATPILLPKDGFVGYIGRTLDITEERRLEHSHRDLASRLIQAQEAERSRIARELHDDVGQELAILSIEMQRAGKPVSGFPGRRHPDVSELSDKVTEISRRIAHISHLLHSSVLDHLGLRVAVQSACREFADRKKIQVQYSATNVPDTIHGIVGLCFLRVVQEALHNIDKHSGAKKVVVRLIGDDNHLILDIRDDGHGFDVEQAQLAAGLGLISMRERMHLIGGSFDLASGSTGTRIIVRAPIIPYANAQNAKNESGDDQL